MNLFSRNGRFKSGTKDLNVWPFYEKDERLGCMKEYNGLTLEQSKIVTQATSRIHNYFTKMVVQFQTFINPMYYSSRDEKKISELKLTETAEDEEDKLMLRNQQVKNLELANLKKHFSLNPLADVESQAQIELFQCREHY
jgi:hypothetical protein